MSRSWWLVVDGLGGRVLWGAFLAFVVATFVSFLGNALWSFGARRDAGQGPPGSSPSIPQASASTC